VDLGGSGKGESIGKKKKDHTDDDEEVLNEIDAFLIEIDKNK